MAVSVYTRSVLNVDTFIYFPEKNQTRLGDSYSIQNVLKI